MATGIKYLMHSPKAHDCYFIVGEKEEKIGVVKELVVQVSDTLRRMLVESDLRETGPVLMPDIYPDAVNIFLTFAYGGRDSAELRGALTGWSKETALHVVDFAEKYLVEDLKSLTLLQLMPTTVENLFPALHCVALYNAPSLEPTVQEIVVKDTEEVLQHPDFLNICRDALMFILKQDGLSVPEVEMWKAAVAWAKNNVEGGETLRSVLEQPLKHIRLYTLSCEDFWSLVEPSTVFTKEEVYEYSKAVHQKTFTPSNIFDSRTERRRIKEINTFVYIRHGNIYYNHNSVDQSSYTLHVNKKMKILSFECYPISNSMQNQHGRNARYSTNRAASTDVTVTVELKGFSEDGEVVQIPVQIDEAFQLINDEEIEIPLTTTDIGRTTMLPGVKYKLGIYFSNIMSALSCPSCQGHQFEAGKIYCNDGYSIINRLHVAYYE